MFDIFCAMLIARRLFLIISQFILSYYCLIQEIFLDHVKGSALGVMELKRYIWDNFYSQMFVLKLEAERPKKLKYRYF